MVARAGIELRHADFQALRYKEPMRPRKIEALTASPSCSHCSMSLAWNLRRRYIELRAIGSVICTPKESEIHSLAANAPEPQGVRSLPDARG